MMPTIGHVAEGEKVLILGASGGVGTCCLQLAKLAGAEVIACAGSDDKPERLAELGADNPSTTSRTTSRRVYRDLRQAARAAPVPTRASTSSSTSPAATPGCRRCGAAVGGRLLTCGATAGFDPKEDIRYIWTFELQVLGSNGWMREDIEHAARAGAGGQAQAADRPGLSLAEASEALRLIEDREVFGKVVVTP